MYSKEEAKKLKEEFWTSFGQYIAVVPSADGLKVNWVNYKTGIRHLQFKMSADNKKAAIAIEISHPDASIRSLMYDQFEQYRMLLEQSLEEAWSWELNDTDDYGKAVARISISIPDHSIYNKNHWPALISFFKPRIIALDDFWSTAKYGFDIFK